METKALKKQMGAAIAMVLVAAIALAASTYAWFVSNNTVKATTASVSAQSNAPFLKIAKTGDALVSTSATQVANGAKTDLYPAQWNHQVETGTYQFESAYAKDASKADMLENSRFAVSAEKIGDYALKQSFDIGTTDANAGSFADLKVSNVAVNAGTIDGQNENKLKDAICVLVKCGEQWTVWNANGELTQYGDATNISNNLTGNSHNALVDTVQAGSDNKVTVDVYVFYDGSQSNVFSDNLASLKDCGVTVSFTAIPVNTDGNEVNVSNAA